MTSNSPAAPDNIPPPSCAAYFLDFDGTLVDIAPTPESVIVPPRLTDNLRRIRALAGDALAIVSGRPVEQVDAFLPNVAFAVAGEHGSALRASPGADIVVQRIPPMPADWLEQAARFAAIHPGCRLETKRHGFALHYRAAPEAGSAIEESLRRMIAALPGRYEMLASKMAWEVRPTGVDKGAAVRALMAQAPFAGRLPIFVGDDVTDEDGMAAACAFGGVGLRVPEVFADPAAVRAWIAHLSGAPHR